MFRIIAYNIGVQSLRSSEKKVSSVVLIHARTLESLRHTRSFPGLTDGVCMCDYTVLKFWTIVNVQC